MNESVDLARLPSGRLEEETRSDSEEIASTLELDVVEFDLVDRVGRALRISGYSPLHSIEVSVRDHVIVLRGKVPSYHMKQLAQVVTIDVPGVRQLRNDIVVAIPEASDGKCTSCEDEPSRE
jgi:hypothetical protein